MTRTTLPATLALLAAGALLPACFLAPEYAFIEADDVEIEPVRGAEFRASTEYGDLYAIAMQSAHDVSGWVASAVETTQKVIDLLDRFPADVDAEGFKVYGPYHPKESAVSWLFRFDGDVDGARFEAWVGDPAAAGIEDMERLLGGSLAIEGSRRSGAFAVDFDVLEARGDALKGGPDRDRHYTGVVTLTFERDLESDLKRVDIDYSDFTVTQEVPIHDFFAATRYAFHREADGAGDFHVDIASTFQAALWSGPEVETMVIDMEWGPSGAGRAHGEVHDRYGDAPGDLLLGDLVLDECFDERGGLLWRQLGEPYASALTGYNRGQASECR
ncbi:MAG: hypothetical protein R3B09_33200 [Nannocystaceae bacterium]